MITEMLISAAGVATYRACESYYKNNKWKTKAIKEDIKTFNEVCKFKEELFLLIDGMETKYGTKFITSLKNKSMKKLEDMKEQLEIYYKSEVEIEQNDNKCTATIDVYKNKIDELTKFEPVILEPYELYVALSKKFELMTADMREHTHVLVSGANGTGKSKEIQMMLTNLIYPNKSNVEIYISNKTNSPDFREFLNCHQVKGYVDNMSDTMAMLNHIMHMFDKRLRIINARNCDNIVDFNKKHKNNQMTYVYLVIDEFAQYFPDNKGEDEYKDKEQAGIMLKRMAEILRKTGIYLLIATQRPDKNSLSPSMKCNLRTKLGFSQENQPSSLVVADDTSLVGVPNREFLYMFGSQRVWCKTLYITTDMIREFVKPSVIKDRRNKEDFNLFLKIKQQNNEAPESDAKETKGKAKASTTKKTKKDKVVNTEEAKTRVKNVSCEEIDDYEIINGQICTRIKRRVD